MALKNFTLSPMWWSDWRGSGHTAETDPGRRGWRAALLKKGSDLVVVGRRGVAGCLTVRLLGDGRIDVATYDYVAPEALLQGIPTADAFKVVDLIPGWALPFIQEIEDVAEIEATTSAKVPDGQ
jgi:hypothetical protein